MIVHKSPISGIAAYQNKYVATAGYDNTIILWDGETGMSLARGCHDHLVNQCAFSPNGKLLASTSSDYTTRIWEVPTMKIKTILIGHDDDTEGVSFHPTKELIATCSRDTTIKVFDYSGKVIRTFEGHTDDVISVEWMKNVDTLISSSDDGTVKFWDFETGELLKDLSFDDVETDTIAVSKEGIILAGNDEGEIVVIDNDTIKNVPAHAAGIKRLVYSDATGKLISLSYDRSFKVWNLNGNDLVMEASHQFNNMVWPRSCAFLNNEDVVFGTFGTKYAQFNLKTKTWNHDNVEPTLGINAACEVNGDVFAIGDAGYVFKNGETVTKLGSLCNFIIDFKGHVITGGQTGEIFDANTGEVYFQHNSPLNCATNFSHNGKPAMAIGAYTGEAIILVIDENENVKYLDKFKFHENAIKGISATSSTIFSVCATGSAAYHNTDTFERESYIKEAHDKIANGCVQCGNEGFASISRDLKLRFWNGGDAVVVDTQHENSIKSVTSDNAGRYIALGDYTGFISIFDKQSHEFVAFKRVSDFGVSSICFGETENKFIASCYDGKLYDIFHVNN